MITAIDGSLALVQKDGGYLSYIYYTVHCSDSSDSKIKLRSVFQIKFDKSYELTAKINDLNEAKLLLINSKKNKDYLNVWLNIVENRGGFFLQKVYIYSGVVGVPKKEEKFVKVPTDYFFGVKTAVDCIRDDLLYG